MKHILLTILLSASVGISAEDYIRNTCRGQVLDVETGDPIEYVSIGLERQNTGTVSADDGIFLIPFDQQFHDDTIRFSSIGYHTIRMAVSDFREQNDRDIKLRAKTIELQQITIDPIELRSRVLGNKYKNTSIDAGFDINRKGYEMGVLLDIDKPTYLEEVTFNLAKCSYSQLFYRLNIYRQNEDGTFENILQNPIYIDKRIDETTPNLAVSLLEYNILVDSNTLITLEHVKNMGEGRLSFMAKKNMSRGSTCYYRTSSMGAWEKSPYKMGFSVKVKEEK